MNSKVKFILPLAVIILLCPSISTHHQTGRKGINRWRYNINSGNVKGNFNLQEITENEYQNMPEDWKAIVLQWNGEENGRLKQEAIQFFQVVAPYLLPHGYKFYVIRGEFGKTSLRSGWFSNREYSIYTYNYGYRMEYLGVLNPNIFIHWIKKMPNRPVIIINSEERFQRFNCGLANRPKVITYVKPGSKSFMNYQFIATKLISYMDFYAVVNSQWALQLGTTNRNQILLYIPYEMEPLVAPQLAKENITELYKWLVDSHTPMLHILNSFNFNQFWRFQKPNENLAIAFIDRRNQRGDKFFKLLVTFTTKFGSKYKGKLQIWVIECKQFGMVDWERMFGIEFSNDGVLMGLAQLETAQLHTFDTHQLNFSSIEEENLTLALLNRWFEIIALGAIPNNDLLQHGAINKTRYRSSLTKGILERSKPKKIKRVTLKDPKRQHGKKHTDYMDSNLPTAQNVNTGLMDICEYEQARLLERIQVLEKRVQFLEHMRKSEKPQSPSSQPNTNLLPKSVPSTRLQESKRNVSSLTFRQLSVSHQKLHQTEVFPPLSLPPSLKSIKRGTYKKAPRRCTRKNLKNCNFMEYHTTVNPIALYFVCALLISMLRAMRITVSLYVCPVIDDWRDVLRRRLPQRIQQALANLNVRF